MSQRPTFAFVGGSSSADPVFTHRSKKWSLLAAAVLAAACGSLAGSRQASASIVLQMGETGTSVISKLIGSSTTATINLIATNTTASPIDVNLAQLGLSWTFSGPAGSATDLAPSPSNAGSFVVSNPGQLFDPIDPSVGYTAGSASVGYTIFTNPTPATAVVTLAPNSPAVVGAITFSVGSPVTSGTFTYAFNTNVASYGFGDSNVSENFIEVSNGGGYLVVVPEATTGVLLGCAGLITGGGASLRRWNRRRRALRHRADVATA